MPQFRGATIDIGGPLRISDKEVYVGENLAFQKNFGVPLRRGSQMEYWQLYGIFAEEGYTGFMKNALAAERADRNVQDFFRASEGPVAAFLAARERYLRPKDAERITAAAKEAKDHYMANQSKRLAHLAREGLDLLDGYEIPMGIITSVQTPDAIRWIHENGLHKYFPDDRVFGNTPDGLLKKDEKPGHLLRFAELIGQPPEQTLYIADSRGDMIAVQEAARQRNMPRALPIAMIQTGMTPPELFSGFLDELNKSGPAFVHEENYFERANLYDSAGIVVRSIGLRPTA